MPVRQILEMGIDMGRLFVDHQAKVKEAAKFQDIQLPSDSLTVCLEETLR